MAASHRNAKLERMTVYTISPSLTTVRFPAQRQAKSEVTILTRQIATFDSIGETSSQIKDPLP